MTDNEHVPLSAIENSVGIDASGAALDGYNRRQAARQEQRTVPATHTVKGVRNAAWTYEEYYAQLDKPPRKRKSGPSNTRPRPANYCYGLNEAVEAWESGAVRERETYVHYGHHDPERCKYCTRRAASLPDLCTHCHLKPIRAKGICRPCADWKRDHHGELPPPEIVDRRRARSEKGESQ